LDRRTANLVLNNMKKYTLSLFLFFLIIGSSFAQRPDANYDPEKLQAARVAFITSRLNLKPEQAERFWPIFNQYTSSREKTLKEISNINRGQENQISEAAAKQQILKKFELQRKMVDDEEKFVNDVSKVITYSQVLELNKIARDFSRQLYQRGKNNP
jgi:hypothetical protein